MTRSVLPRGPSIHPRPLDLCHAPTPSPPHVRQRRLPSRRDRRRLRRPRRPRRRAGRSRSSGRSGTAPARPHRSMQNLPEELKAAPLAQRTRVLDRDGNPIATFYDENRVNVPLNRVSPIMQRAIIAIEDYRFYQHGALDLKGTLRAFVNNQTSGGGTQGGSSITQQMAKMTLLTQAQHRGGAQGGHREHLPAQDPGAAARDRVRAELLQGLDPRALPQPRLLRRRRLRHPGGRPALLLASTPASSTRSRPPPSPAW